MTKLTIETAAEKYVIETQREQLDIQELCRDVVIPLLMAAGF